jgi:hypothetical protein
VQVDLAQGAPITGRVAEAGDDDVVLQPDGAADPVRLPLDQVTRAVVQVEFTKPDGG